jgi:cytochrome d ubiquinol oxidase subunit II
MTELNGLPALWLALTGGFWVLYLAFGGADLGVSMLVRRVGGDDAGRAAVLESIGPTWQANDVWLIIAVGAMFGAFPGWYAEWASGAYLPLLAILVALIVRHAGIELLGHLGKGSRRRWTAAIGASAWVTAFGWGVIWASALDGSLAGAGPSGGLDVLSPTTVLCGLALAALCRATGAAFLARRLDGVLAQRARRQLRVAAPVAALLAVSATLELSLSAETGTAPGVAGWVLLAMSGVALAVLAVAGLRRRARAALWAGGIAVAALLAALFVALAPYGIAGPGGVDLRAEAAGSYTLTLMTVVAAVVGPAVLAVHAYAYLRFPSRDTAARPGKGSPLARLARRGLQGLR